MIIPGECGRKDEVGDDVKVSTGWWCWGCSYRYEEPSVGKYEVWNVEVVDVCLVKRACWHTCTKIVRAPQRCSPYAWTKSFSGTDEFEQGFAAVLTSCGNGDVIDGPLNVFTCSKGLKMELQTRSHGSCLLKAFEHVLRPRQKSVKIRSWNRHKQNTVSEFSDWRLLGLDLETVT